MKQDEVFFQVQQRPRSRSAAGGRRRRRSDEPADPTGAAAPATSADRMRAGTYTPAQAIRYDAPSGHAAHHLAPQPAPARSGATRRLVARPAQGRPLRARGRAPGRRLLGARRRAGNADRHRRALARPACARARRARTAERTLVVPARALRRDRRRCRRASACSPSSRRPRRAPPRRRDFHLLLEDVQDPGNVGSILRTAAAAGVEQVLLSKHCAFAWSPKVLRAGQGAHFCVDDRRGRRPCRVGKRHRARAASGRDGRARRRRASTPRRSRAVWPSRSATKARACRRRSLRRRRARDDSDAGRASSRSTPPRRRRSCCSSCVRAAQERRLRQALRDAQIADRTQRRRSRSASRLVQQTSGCADRSRGGRQRAACGMPLRRAPACSAIRQPRLRRARAATERRDRAPPRARRRTRRRRRVVSTTSTSGAAASHQRSRWPLQARRASRASRSSRSRAASMHRGGEGFGRRAVSPHAAASDSASCSLTIRTSTRRSSVGGQRRPRARH